MSKKVPLKITKLMKEFKQGLQEIYRERLKGVYLYGSYARGDYRAGSDVDVMILMSDFENYWKELHLSSQLTSDISLKYDVTVSRLLLKEIQWQTEKNERPIIYNIQKEGLSV